MNESDRQVVLAEARRTVELAQRLIRELEAFPWPISNGAKWSLEHKAAEVQRAAARAHASLARIAAPPERFRTSEPGNG